MDVRTQMRSAAHDNAPGTMYQGNGQTDGTTYCDDGPVAAGRRSLASAKDRYVAS